jgi:hypothetical protein
VLITSFVKWLYGSDFEQDECYSTERWYLGQKLGSPKFQNASMRYLCNNTSLPRTNSYAELDFFFYAEPIGGDSLQRALNHADFSNDEKNGFRVDFYEVYWGNKQMLRFILDAFAFIGTRDSEVLIAIEEGGKFVVQFMMIIHAAVEAGGFHRALWKEKNLQKYLVDEKMT